MIVQTSLAVLSPPKTYIADFCRPPLITEFGVHCDLNGLPTSLDSLQVSFRLFFCLETHGLGFLHGSNLRAQFKRAPRGQPFGSHAHLSFFCTNESPKHSVFFVPLIFFWFVFVSFFHCSIVQLPELRCGSVSCSVVWCRVE